jgi:hypothetical protein
MNRMSSSMDSSRATRSLCYTATIYAFLAVLAVVAAGCSNNDEEGAIVPAIAVKRAFATAGVGLGPEKSFDVGDCELFLGEVMRVEVLVCDQKQEPETFQVGVLRPSGTEQPDGEVVFGYGNVVVFYRGQSLAGPNQEEDLRRIRKAIAQLRE